MLSIAGSPPPVVSRGSLATRTRLGKSGEELTPTEEKGSNFPMGMNAKKASAMGQTPFRRCSRKV